MAYIEGVDKHVKGIDLALRWICLLTRDYGFVQAELDPTTFVPLCPLRDTSHPAGYSSIRPAQDPQRLKPSRYGKLSSWKPKSRQRLLSDLYSTDDPVMAGTRKPYVWPKLALHREIEPYITRNGDAHMLGQEMENGACRFWQVHGQTSAFISHYEWREGGEVRELSRSDVIETWSKTLTRIGEIICVHDTVLTARGICGKIAYTGYKDEGERLRCEQIDEWLRKIRPLHRYFTLFLRELIAIEDRPVPPFSWSQSLESLPYSTEIEPYIELDFGKSTIPFQVISVLKGTIMVPGQLAVLHDFSRQFNITLPITDTPFPTGYWVSYLQDGGQGPVNVPRPACEAKGWMPLAWMLRRRTQIVGEEESKWVSMVSMALMGLVKVFSTRVSPKISSPTIPMCMSASYTGPVTPAQGLIRLIAPGRDPSPQQGRFVRIQYTADEQEKTA